MSDTTPRVASSDENDAIAATPIDPTAETDAELTTTPDAVAAEAENPVAETTEETLEAAAAPAEIAEVFRTPPPLPDAPEVSPDGARVAYLLKDAAGINRLWLSPVAGGDAVQIDLPFTPVPDRDPDTGRSLRGPQWSPDGATIAITGSHPDGNPLRTAVWLVPVPAYEAPATPVEAPDADAVVAEVAAETPVTDEAADGVEASAAPAEGDSVVESVEEAASTDAPSETDAEAVAVVASELETGVSVAEDAPAPLAVATPLSDHPTASDRSPRWSPDGMLIAFVRTLDGHDVIALASPIGSLPVAAELLTWSASHDREPSWSRDGLFLAFTRKRLEDVDHNDILVFILATGEIRNLTGEKTSAVRHSLDWVPGRNLVAYVTRENEWLSIAVINSDNKAGWTVTREAGDKVDPRFSPGEPRLVYIRTEGFSSVVCERGLHASGATILDPGEGVGLYPRWVADKRALYGFSAAQRPFGFIVQDNSADAERSAIDLPGIPALAGRDFRRPTTFEFEVGSDAQFSGLLYRTDGVSGKVPGIVYLPDGPLSTRRAEFQPQEQALARTAMAVLSPVLHGASGFGSAIENDLAELADTELEMSDIVESGVALGKIADIDEKKLAVVGHGYGGALALLTAGGRPGVFSAVAVVDPITDWAIELEEATPAWRTWITRQYGMPLTDRDRYAMRTPDTFAAVIDVPLVLVGTGVSANRTAQLDLFTGFLDEIGVSYERIDASGTSIPEALAIAGRRLANHFLEGRDEVQVVSSLRADEA
ncbi:MAG: prolyl oligopeptidase family serine peptidase [Thermomicrobiales bacterium]